MTWCFDTSAFIEPWVRLYPPDIFAPVWDKIEELAEAKVITAPADVLLELEKQKDDLHDWAKARPDLFEAPDRQLRANELGAALAWEKSRVSHQVSRMEKRGLVERRECDTDLRGTWVGMTADGRRAVLSAMRDHGESLRRFFFDALTPEELAAIQSASTKVLDVVLPANCEVLGDA